MSYKLFYIIKGPIEFIILSLKLYWVGPGCFHDV